MTTTTYGALVDSYLADPTPDNLTALREAIRSAPSFDPDLTLDRSVAPLLEREAWQEAISVLNGVMPGALFSPAAHAHLAVALRHSGRPQEADREESLSRAALRSILSTGDGTARRPWSVLRVSDQYDLLRSLGRRSVRQDLVTEGGRRLDRQVCDDGSEVYFDTTGLLPADG